MLNVNWTPLFISEKFQSEISPEKTQIADGGSNKFLVDIRSLLSSDLKRYVSHNFLKSLTHRTNTSRYFRLAKRSQVLFHNIP